MKRKPDPNPVQRLAMANTSAVLTAAAVARAGAQLLHQHHGKVPEGAIAETVASYAAMLRGAIGSLGKRSQPITTDEDEFC